MLDRTHKYFCRGGDHWKLYIPVLLLAVLLAATSTSALAENQDQKDRQRVKELRAERARLARSKAKAAAQINALAVDDKTLLNALNDLDDQSQELQFQVGEIEKDIAAKEAAVLDARRKENELTKEIESIHLDLQQRAVDAFIQPSAHIVNQYDIDSLGRSSIKFYLLDYVIGRELDSTDALRVAENALELEQNRVLREQQTAQEMKSTLFESLKDLEEFREQAEILRAEYQERRLAWENEVSEVRRADLEIAGEIASIETAIKKREQERLRQEAEARRRAAEEARRLAEQRDGPFQLIQWPSRGKITSGFGIRRHPIFGVLRPHNGIDIDGDTGDPVWASRSGEVVIAARRTGYGNTIVISHGLGYSTLYAHLSRFSVSVGDEVTSGDRIGSVGSTGWSTGPHLHFEIRIDGKAVNPIPFLPP